MAKSKVSLVNSCVKYGKTVVIYLFNKFKNHVHTFIVNRNIPVVYKNDNTVLAWHMFA